MIRRSTWLALGLLAAAILAAVIWSRTDGGRAAEESGSASTPEPLWTVESAAIEQLVVESGEGKVLLAAARDASAGWVLSQPHAGPAEAGRLERAVSWLASPPVRDVIDASGDLTPFELDPPRYRARVITREGDEWSFDIGRQAPTGDTMYARIADRAGILLLSRYGVEEVLNLLDPIPLAPSVTVDGATTEP